jgi:hypothetical protein
VYWISAAIAFLGQMSEEIDDEISDQLKEDAGSRREVAVMLQLLQALAKLWHPIFAEHRYTIGRR